MRNRILAGCTGSFPPPNLHRGLRPHRLCERSEAISGFIPRDCHVARQKARRAPRNDEGTERKHPFLMLLTVGVLLMQGCVANVPVQKGFFTTPAIRQKWNQIPKTAQGVSKTSEIGPGFDYLLLLPAFREGETYRLILVLHGAGDTMENYLEIWKSEALKHNTILAVPQITPSVTLLNKDQDSSLYLDFVKDLQRRYPVNPKKIYIAGTSMGGFAATLIIQKLPKLWRGGILIASYGFKDCFSVQDIQSVNNYTVFPPLLYVHGMKDLYHYKSVLDGVGFLLDQGVKVQLYSYENAGHEHRPEWNKRIFEWMEKVEFQPVLAVPPPRSSGEARRGRISTVMA